MPRNNNNNNSVRGSIRTAGGNGNISRRELQEISRQTGVDAGRIIRQLDKVNANRAGNNKAPVGLGSAAYNSLLKSPTSRTMMGRAMSGFGLSDRYNYYGSGGIGQAIMQGRGTSDYYGNSTAGTGRIPQGQQVFGSYNGAPQLQINPQNNVNAGNSGLGAGPYDGMEITPSDPNGPGPWANGTGGDSLPLPLPKEEEAPSYESANNAALYGNAGGFKQNKSSWKRSGKSSNGTNNLKINATKSASGVGINTRGF